MAAITLEVAKKHLEMWLEAESEVAINQSYTIGGKSFTRANLAEIRKQIEYWSNKVAELENLAKKKNVTQIIRTLHISNACNFIGSSICIRFGTGDYTKFNDRATGNYLICDRRIYRKLVAGLERN